MRQPASKNVAAASLALALGLAMPLAGDDFWKKKPASEWTVEEALKVVQDSRWAHEEIVPTPLVLVPRRSAEPRGSEPLPAPSPAPSAPSRMDSSPTAPRRDRTLPPVTAPLVFDVATYLVRWETARPVSEAFARLDELGEQSSAQFQSPAPRLPADRYVVTVKTTRPGRTAPDIFLHLTEHQLREAARLKTRRGVVPPLEVEYSGVGANAAVHFFFPRLYQNQPLLREGEDVVEFKFTLGRFKLTTKFKIETAFLPR